MHGRFAPCTRVMCVHADVRSCSQTVLRSSPYRPAVCRACGSPPRISAAPPRRCEPLWRRPANKSCRGCRCQGAAPRIHPTPGGPPVILTAAAPAQHPHLKKHKYIYIPDLNLFGTIITFCFNSRSTVSLSWPALSSLLYLMKNLTPKAVERVVWVG